MLVAIQVDALEDGIVEAVEMPVPEHTAGHLGAHLLVLPDDLQSIVGQLEHRAAAVLARGDEDALPDHDRGGGVDVVIGLPLVAGDLLAAGLVVDEEPVAVEDQEAGAAIEVIRERRGVSVPRLTRLPDFLAGVLVQGEGAANIDIDHVIHDQG